MTSIAPVSVTTGLNQYSRGPASRGFDGDADRRRPARRLFGRRGHRLATGASEAARRRDEARRFAAATLDQGPAEMWALNAAPGWSRRWSI